MRAGLYDEAIEICKDALKINQSWSSFYRLEAKSHWLKGDREKAYASIERYGNSFPNYQERKYYYSGLFFSFDGQYKKALTELVKAAEISQTKMNTSLEMGVRFDIGKLLTEMGQSSRALEEFAQAQELSKDVYDESFDPVPILVNYLAGIAMVKKGDYKAAQDHAAKIEKYIRDKNYDMLNMDYNHLLNAEIHAAQGKGQATKDSLEKVSFRARDYSARYAILMSKSLALLGETEKAIQSYLQYPNEVNRSETSMADPFHFFWGSSRVDYFVARIYEDQGNAPKAIAHYEKFLELWTNADPGIKEVEDAKKKLADLKSGY